MVVLTDSALIGVKDPYGIRPLVLGKKDDGYVLASETCAFDIIGAEYIRDIENGEMVIIDKLGIKSYQLHEGIKPRPCMSVFIFRGLAA